MVQNIPNDPPNQFDDLISTTNESVHAGSHVRWNDDEDLNNVVQQLRKHRKVH
jgi:hypothetical protein